MKYICTILSFLIPVTMFSQVGINTENPESSAEFHIYSTSKGIILPKLTNAEMLDIGSPANGLIVFNTSFSSYYYFNGTSWATIGGGGNSLQDADGDTKIQFEKTIDEDTIRIDIGNNLGAVHTDILKVTAAKTVVNGNYELPIGKTVKLGASQYSFPTTVGEKGTVLSTNGLGDWTWEEAHTSLGIASGIQTMYFAEAYSATAINSNTYYIPVIPFSSISIDTMNVYVVSVSGSPLLKFAVFDSEGNQIAVSTEKAATGAGLFEGVLTSDVKLESSHLYYFAITDINNTATTILSNLQAANPFNKTDTTSSLSSLTMGSPSVADRSIWIASH